MKRIKLGLLGAAMTGLVLVALSSGAGTALAAPAVTVPFTDHNVTGTLGFCDKAGKPLTSGSTTTVPFAWTAVSSTPAPKAYAVSTGKATLYAFSPIKYVDPGDWSPYQMTSSSYYSNLAHPMAGATYGDAPLQYQTTAFPPTWNGLVQLRLNYSAANMPPENTSYPAAVIQVTGTKWTLVQGNRNPDCSVGRAKSAEDILLPAKKRPTAPPSGSTSTPGSSPSPSPTSSVGGQSGDSTASPSPSDSSGVSATQAAADDTSPSSSAAPIAIGLLGLTAFIAAAGGFWFWRRSM